MRADDLSEALRLLLKRAGMNATDLADASGLGNSTVGNYLKHSQDGGRIPNARDLRTIAAVLADHLELPADDVWLELGGVLDEMPARDDATPAKLRIAARRRVRGRSRG